MPYRPSQRHHVLDERHVGDDDLPRPNLVTAVVRMERIASPSDLIQVLAGIADPERLAEVGEWLVRCETGEAFLERVESALDVGDRRGA